MEHDENPEDPRASGSIQIELTEACAESPHNDLLREARFLHESIIDLDHPFSPPNERMTEDELRTYIEQVARLVKRSEAPTASDPESSSTAEPSAKGSKPSTIGAGVLARLNRQPSGLGGLSLEEEPVFPLSAPKRPSQDSDRELRGQAPVRDDGRAKAREGMDTLSSLAEQLMSTRGRVGTSATTVASGSSGAQAPRTEMSPAPPATGPSPSAVEQPPASPNISTSSTVSRDEPGERDAWRVAFMALVRQAPRSNEGPSKGQDPPLGNDKTPEKKEDPSPGKERPAETEKKDPPPNKEQPREAEGPTVKEPPASQPEVKSQVNEVKAPNKTSRLRELAGPIVIIVILILIAFMMSWQLVDRVLKSTRNATTDTVEQPSRMVEPSTPHVVRPRVEEPVAEPMPPPPPPRPPPVIFPITPITTESAPRLTDACASGTPYACDRMSPPGFRCQSVRRVLPDETSERLAHWRHPNIERSTGSWYFMNLRTFQYVSVENCDGNCGPGPLQTDGTLNLTGSAILWCEPITTP